MDESQKIDFSTEPASRRHSRRSRLMLVVIGGLPALATVLALGGRWWWPLDVLADFRVQYSLVLGIMALAALFVRQWRLALLAGLPLAINLGFIAPVYLHPRWLEPHPEFLAQQVDRGPTLKLMTYSLSANHDPTEKLLELLRQSEADIILLQGITPKWLEELEYAVAPFRVLDETARDDDLGLAVLVRVSIRPMVTVTDVQRVDMLALADDPVQENPPPPYIVNPNPAGADDETSDANDGDISAASSSRLEGISLQVRWQQRKLAILTFRSAIPLTQSQALKQARQFDAAARWVKRQDRPAIIVGDLGATPWSWRFRQLLEETDLANSQLGFGVQGTWPATGGAPGRIPLDHCLLDPSLVMHSRQLGPSLTSSHHPLDLEIQWAGGASDPPRQSGHWQSDDDSQPPVQKQYWRRPRWLPR